MTWLLLMWLCVSIVVGSLVGTVLRLSRENQEARGCLKDLAGENEELTLSVVEAHKRINELAQAHAELLGAQEAMSKGMGECCRVVWFLVRMHGEVVESAEVAKRARKAGDN